MKLTDAQRRRLSHAPTEWQTMPFFGDMRPMAPLVRAKLVEERQIDTTPADWGVGPVRVVRHEWRITPAGRVALSDEVTR